MMAAATAPNNEKMIAIKITGFFASMETAFVLLIAPLRLFPFISSLPCLLPPDNIKLALFLSLDTLGQFT
jgi:hypothetical protein